MGQYGTTRDALTHAVKAINDAESKDGRKERVIYLEGLCGGIGLSQWDDSEIQEMLKGVDVPDDVKMIIFE